MSLPYLRVANVKRGELDLSVIKEVHIAKHEVERYALRENDLLMTEGGDWDKVGRAAIWRGEIPLCLHQNHVFRARMRSQKVNLLWFERYFNSSDGRSYFEAASKQTTNLASINMRQVRGCPVPFPPLAEQKRILTKVEELMALCDRLEAQQKERETRHMALARASLARFAVAPTPANLNLLFHKSYSIEPADLRITILNLAVTGKLTFQSASEEPAEILLTRIAQKTRAGVENPKKGYESPGAGLHLPLGWALAKFRDVALIKSSLVDPAEFPEYPHLAPDNIEKGTGTLLPCCTIRDAKVISPKHHFFPGQIIYSKIRPNLAKVVLVQFEGLCSADMYPIDPLIDPEFLKLYMLSDVFLRQAVKNDTRVAMPKINQGELNEISVLVPPVPEQWRIVEKVEQLVEKVEQLQKQLAAAQSTAKTLMEAVVAELTTRNGTYQEVNPAFLPVGIPGTAKRDR